MAGRGRDGLLRWLLGGFAAGVAILGLLVAAYAIGYNRGEKEAAGRAAPATPAAPAAPAPPATTSEEPASGEELAEQGEELFTDLGCSGCHSTGTETGAGPGLGGLAGSTQTLTDGRTVTVDHDYLVRALTDPDADVPEGYQAGVMTAATTPLDLPSKPDEVEALVAYLETL